MVNDDLFIYRLVVVHYFMVHNWLRNHSEFNRLNFVHGLLSSHRDWLVPNLDSLLFV